MSNGAKLISPDDPRLLYDNLKNVLFQMYFDIHAIYEPDGCGPFGDCYMAAVDLFKQGLTFRIYFKYATEKSLDIMNAERWHFG